MQYTEDSIIRPGIRIRQPVKGYRFTIDAVLLGTFIRCRPTDVLLEIGAGSGVVTILLASRQKYGSVTALELQQELAELCRTNFDLNQLKNANVIQQDLRNAEKLFAPESFDLIYGNPPYRKKGHGKLNPSLQKAIARHEIRMTLQEIFQAAMLLLKADGRLAMILPSFREKDFHTLVKRFGFHLLEWQYVHSFAGEPPIFLLTTLGKSPGMIFQHPAIVIYDAPGKYSPQINALLRGGCLSDES